MTSMLSPQNLVVVGHEDRLLDVVEAQMRTVEDELANLSQVLSSFTLAGVIREPEPITETPEFESETARRLYAHAESMHDVIDQIRHLRTHFTGKQ